MERITFEPGHVLQDARFLFASPSEFFFRLEPQGPLGRPTVHITFWALIAGILDTVLVFAGLQEGSTSALVNLVTIALFPPVVILFLLLIASLYHLFAKVIGGYGPWSGSYRVLSALAATIPLEVVATALPVLKLPLLAYRCFLLVHATIGIHSVPPRRAWAAIGTLFALAACLQAYSWLK